MGSIREKELKAQLKNLQKIETTEGWNFSITKLRVRNQGTLDYKMKQAINYRNNYIKEMEKYKNYDNYELLEKKLQQTTNPITFFKLMSANELTQDLTYQSDEVLSQEEFNSFLNDLGIETDEVIYSADQEQRNIINELEIYDYQEAKKKN